MGELQHSLDAYNCVVVNAGDLPSDQVNQFAQLLAHSLEAWKSLGRKAIKLNIPTSLSELVPIAIGLGFEYHHAQPGYACLAIIFHGAIPRYPFTTVGVGAFLVCEEKVLLIREKTGPFRGWKMSGGYVDPGETLTDAVLRELREETGIPSSAVSVDGILCLRQLLKFKWPDTGDLYFVVLMHTKDSGGNLPTAPCPIEIEEIDWKPIGDILAGKQQVSGITKLATQKFSEWKLGSKLLLKSEQIEIRDGAPVFLYS